MRTSDTTGELAAALAKAQGAMDGASKDAKNPHLKNSYADLAAVWAACREVLSNSGLAVSQGLSTELITVKKADGADEVWGWVVRCVTRLSHSSGEWVEETLTLPAVEQKGISMAQSIGATATYARRYGLSAMVGITQEDNDGHVGAKRKPRERQARKQQRQAKHEPSWEESRAAFCARLGELGWTYDDLADFCVFQGAPRPSAMTEGQRQKTMGRLANPTTDFDSSVSKWVASKSAK